MTLQDLTAIAKAYNELGTPKYHTLLLKTDHGVLKIEQKKEGVLQDLARLFLPNQHYTISEKSVTVQKLRQLQKELENCEATDEVKKGVEIVNGILGHVQDSRGRISGKHSKIEKKKAKIDAFFQSLQLTCKTQITCKNQKRKVRFAVDPLRVKVDPPVDSIKKNITHFDARKNGYHRFGIYEPLSQKKPVAARIAKVYDEEFSGIDFDGTWPFTTPTEYGESGTLKRSLYASCCNQIDRQVRVIDQVADGNWQEAMQALGDELFLADLLIRAKEGESDAQLKVYHYLLQQLIKKVIGFFDYQNTPSPELAKALSTIMAVDKRVQPCEFLSVSRLDEKKQQIINELKRFKVDMIMINAVDDQNFKSKSLNELLDELEAYRKKLDR